MFFKVIHLWRISLYAACFYKLYVLYRGVGKPGFIQDGVSLEQGFFKLFLSGLPPPFKTYGESQQGFRLCGLYLWIFTILKMDAFGAATASRDHLCGIFNIV